MDTDEMRTLHMLHSLDAEVASLASTVRNGFKWADLEEGEEILLCVCKDRCLSSDCGQDDPCENCTPSGIGKVAELWFGRFHEVPARLLKFEHEVRSREYRGLLDSMRKAYGQDFEEWAPVTVIIYYRVS